MIEILYSYTMDMWFGAKGLKKVVGDTTLLKAEILEEFLWSNVWDEYSSLRTESFDHNWFDNVFKMFESRMREVTGWRNVDIFATDQIRYLANSEATPIIYDVVNSLGGFFDALKQRILNIRSEDLRIDAKYTVIDTTRLVLNRLLEDVYKPLSPMAEVARKELVSVLSMIELSYDSDSISLEMPLHPFVSVIDANKYASIQLKIFYRLLRSIILRKCIFQLVLRCGGIYWGNADVEIDKSIRIRLRPNVNISYVLEKKEYGEFVSESVTLASYYITSVNGQKHGGIVRVINPFRFSIVAPPPQCSYYDIQKFMDKCSMTISDFEHIKEEVEKLDGMKLEINVFNGLLDADIMLPLFVLNPELVKEYLTSYYIGLSLFLEDLWSIIKSE